jgi:hypothetical protein
MNILIFFFCSLTVNLFTNRASINLYEYKLNFKSLCQHYRQLYQVAIIALLMHKPLFVFLVSDRHIHIYNQWVFSPLPPGIPPPLKLFLIEFFDNYALAKKGLKTLCLYDHQLKILNDLGNTFSYQKAIYG